MVWAGIHGGGKTDIVFIHVNMTAQRYCHEIITPVVIPFLQQRHGFLFQHTAKLTTNLLERNHIQVLTWPPKSPDLSPIEHAWDLLGRENYPHILNVHDLQIALNREWNGITVPEINGVIRSMSLRRRCTAVTNAAGAHTHY